MTSASEASVAAQTDEAKSREELSFSELRGLMARQALSQEIG